MSKKHHYTTKLQWTGNKGTGTSDYKSYQRDHKILVNGKQEIACSSDPSFRGDPTRYNPEEFLVASLSSCHMLWYLHLCAVNGVVVTGYTDQAEGTMVENPDGGGQFSSVTLYPNVTVESEAMIKKAMELHEEANKRCFISSSCNFPVHHQPEIFVGGK